MNPIKTPLTTSNGIPGRVRNRIKPPTHANMTVPVRDIPQLRPCRDCDTAHLPSEHCAVSAVPCPACFGPHAPGACPAMIYRPVAMLNCLLAYVGGLCTGVALTALYFTLGN